MHLVTRLSGIGLAAAMCASTSFAGAGQGYFQGVGIHRYGSYNYFEGSLPGARFSSDPHQNIGCFTYASAGGAQAAECYATDASWLSVVCMTSDPSLVAVAGRASMGSSIIVTYDGQANCTYISVDANSQDVL
jgi:hypothetical protein